MDCRIYHICNSIDTGKSVSKTVNKDSGNLATKLMIMLGLGEKRVFQKERMNKNNTICRNVTFEELRTSGFQRYKSCQ